MPKRTATPRRPATMKPTAAIPAPPRSVVPEFPTEYAEDVDDAFEPEDDWGTEITEQAEAATVISGEVTAEDLEDHAAVSSDGAPAGEGEVESPEFGEEEVPAALAAETDLEPVDGYDETLSLADVDREFAMAAVDEERLLDAWYAEFGDSDAMGLVLQQPELRRSLLEVVIGTDDRVQIKNTTAYPWRTICSLRITARDGSNWIGTGWLVGPRTLITAGHVVYMHRRGGWASRIEVIPGRNGSNKPFGSATAFSFRSVKGWTNKKKRSHDYGAIILPSSAPYGRQLGYFGYANLSFFSLLGRRVNLSGYPADKTSGTQWWHARRIKVVTGRTLVYNIDSAGGQSGSPVWRLKNGKRHVVGIHTNGSSSGNSATRIVKPVFNNIKKWKTEGM